MRLYKALIVVIGVVSLAGMAAAYEGEGGPRGEMPPAMQAIKDKYHARREQLHNDCRQKMEALEQEERTEMQAVMKTAHEQRMKAMDEKFQHRMQGMQKKHEQHQ